MIILDCPFCSKPPIFTSMRDVEDGFDHCFSLVCSECGIEMTDEYKDDLLARWNKRSIPTNAMPSEEVLNAGYDAARDQNGLPPEGLVLGHVGKIFVAMINAEVEEQVSKPSIPCEPDPVGIFHAYDQPIEYLHSHDLHAGDQLFVRKVA